MKFAKALYIIGITIVTIYSVGCTGGGSSGGGSDSSSASTQPSNQTLPTISIVTAFDITSANINTYFVVGNCSEDGFPIDVVIGTINTSTICLGSTWSTGNIDVTSLPDSPNILITADHTDAASVSANQATTIVTKNTSTPIVSISVAEPISSANVTDYFVSGFCSENGQVVTIGIDTLIFSSNCSSGIWSTGFVDVSAIPDSTVVDITADHKNSSGDAAVQASISVVKDLALPVVTISSALDINISNQNNYTISGTCSETDQIVDIFIGTVNLIPNCVSNTWVLSAIDVSTLDDNPIIPVTADHKDSSGDAAVQANVQISKATVTPSVSELSLVFTLPDQVNISWSLEDPGGYSIDDYIINYRIKGTGVWLLFDDGVSTSTINSITGLTAATIYEFRVALVYGTNGQSEWSNTLSAETKPIDPIFGENKAMNVGGADESSVVAFEDNTIVTLNGSILVTLNKGETYVFSSSQFDVIDADKPIFTAGRLGPNDAGRFGANIVWNPVTWASKFFSFNATRYSPQRIQIYPIEDGTITVKSGSTVLASSDITAGVGTILEWSPYGSYQISSTGMVLLYHYSSGSGAYVDPKPLLPSSKKMIGFPSRSMRLTASFDGTNYTAIHSNSLKTINSLNKQDSIQINPEGVVTSLYQSDSLVIIADKAVSGASYADANGYSASIFLPVALMKNAFALNADAEYVAFASLKPGFVKVLDSSDNVISIGTLNRSGSDLNSPYKARFENLPAGTRIFSPVQMAAWYQPSGYIASMRYDETTLYGTNLDNPAATFTPPVDPITCLTLKTETASLPDGIYEIDPDGVDGEVPFDAYCDMTTQGGGWTMVIRYDRDLATALNYSLPLNAGRSEINGADMTTLDATSNLAASFDIRPFIKSGTRHFMHVTTAINDTSYSYTYFNDISLFIQMFPDNLFNSNLDSNSGDGVQGTVVNWSETYSNQWYEDDFTVMITSQTSGPASESHKSISYGEGNAMFTNGNREGAVLSSGVATTGSVEGHSDPKVQWGFKGKDGTSQTYGGTTHVGTYCNASLGTACGSVSQMNFMFVR